MRSAKMVELLGGDPEATVISLHHFLRHSGGPQDPNAEVLDAMVVALGGDRLPYAIRAGLYAAAVDRGDTVVARLFLGGRRQKSDTADLEESLTEARSVIPTGRPLTLGERKSLARGKRSDSLLALVRDPHPMSS